MRLDTASLVSRAFTADGPRLFGGACPTCSWCKSLCGSLRRCCFFLCPASDSALDYLTYSCSVEVNLSPVGRRPCWLHYSFADRRVEALPEAVVPTLEPYASRFKISSRDDISVREDLILSANATNYDTLARRTGVVWLTPSLI